jgi:serine/threonine-protein kinase
MSLEQAMSEKGIDHRTDIWAIGVILFEALTGRRPLDFENLGGMYTAFLQGLVPPIRAVLPDLPDDIGVVIERCLEKQREARLGDLEPLIEALDRHTDEAAPGARSGGEVVPRESLTASAQSIRAQTTLRGQEAASRARIKGASRTVVAGVIAAAVLGAGTLVAFRGRGGGTAAIAQPVASAPSRIPDVFEGTAPSAAASSSAASSVSENVPSPATSVSAASSAQALPASGKPRPGQPPGPKPPAPSAAPKAPEPPPKATGIISTPPY